jgi:hypothetical protein
MCALGFAGCAGLTQYADTESFRVAGRGSFEILEVAYSEGFVDNAEEKKNNEQEMKELESECCECVCANTLTTVTAQLKALNKEQVQYKLVLSAVFIRISVRMCVSVVLCA